MTHREKIRENVCDCAIGGRENESTKYCEWNKIYQTNGTHFDQCTIVTKVCPGCPPTNDTCKDAFSNEFTKCFMPASQYPHTFPPHQASVLPSLELDLKKCDYRNNSGMFSGMTSVRDEEFYQYLLTCELPACGPRLRLPAADNGTHPSFQWCLPPIMNSVSQLEYCPLYAQKIPTFGGFSDTQAFHALEYDTMCVLPPLCGNDGKVDRKKFMAPLVNGKWDETYCERVCNENEIEKDCIPVPPCEGNQTITPDPRANRFTKVDRCARWCTEEESVKLSTDSPCIRLPICDFDGKPRPRLNPWHTSRCVMIKNCIEGQNKSTHLCKETVSLDNQNLSSPHFAGRIVASVISLAACGLLILCTLSCCLFEVERWDQEKKREDECRERGLEWKDYKRLREAFCKESALGNYNPRNLRQALVTARKRLIGEEKEGSQRTTTLEPIPQQQQQEKLEKTKNTDK
ncbi:unnamed protein product, partial [Mesorhabditis belari]|uniref:Uncharacterized protein n=1 Tax=Mesorhabditis belari TaxID=2138241 RepID=A0AAF3EE45_9BILA